jgi:5'-nucleotidase
MNILVTNDDGINSTGIYALAKALCSLGTVHIIAPDRQQSAVGHAITLSTPLRVTHVHLDETLHGLSVNGTPADCVKLGISTLLDTKPDLVVSGINHGSNTAINIMYSGTVSAASEGMLMGVRSMAVSLNSFDHSADMTIAADYACRIAKQYSTMNLPLTTVLNVNVPPLPKEHIHGIRITEQGYGAWDDRYEKRTDPYGRDYYWLAGDYIPIIDERNTDDRAMKEGYVSVTPIHFSLTNYNHLTDLSSLGSMTL